MDAAERTLREGESWKNAQVHRLLTGRCHRYPKLMFRCQRHTRTSEAQNERLSLRKRCFFETVCSCSTSDMMEEKSKARRVTSHAARAI